MKFSKRKQVGNFGREAKGSCNITTADRWFSRYVRVRDTKAVVAGDGYGDCITCGKYTMVKYADCGHFVTRNRTACRFHVMNCNLQCKRCNNHGKGEQAKHAIAIDKKYGRGTAEMLINLGSIRGTKKHSKIALKEIAEEYKKLTYELLEEKNMKKWW